MTYLEWIKQASSSLINSESPKRDAEILLEFATQRSRTFLMAFSETELTQNEMLLLDDYLKRRQDGVPIAYITKNKEFWSLPFEVSSDTLIPRPETELLVEIALNNLPNEPCEVLDLGTGTGVIACAIASERSDCIITGIDKIKGAYELAKKNAAKLQLDNVYILLGEWFKPIKKRKFAMIVSNPPYIDPTDVHLAHGDVRYEPRSALVSENNGLFDIQYIITESKKHLTQYGWLIIEHGWNQAADVRMLFKQNSYQLVSTYKDYAGNDRVTIGRLFQ